MKLRSVIGSIYHRLNFQQGNGASKIPEDQTYKTIVNDQINGKNTAQVNKAKLTTNEDQSSTSQIFETGITLLAGGLEKWITKRILIDILQNHVDETRIKKARLWLEGKKKEAIELRPDTKFLLKNGEVISIKEAKDKKTSSKDILSIIFSDEGYGYPQEMLKYILSYGKSFDENTWVLHPCDELGIDPPGGQFGEGQKMVAAATLKIKQEQERKGMVQENQIELIYRSQNWYAKLLGIPMIIQTPKGTINTTSVAFNLVTIPEQIEGSQTIIINPTVEMVELIKEVESLVLDFAEPIEVVAKTEEGTAFTPNGNIPNIFIRGYFINSGIDFATSLGKTKRHPMFSYNLKDITINRDRDQQDLNETICAIGRILYIGADKKLINQLIDEALKKSLAYSLEEGLYYNDNWSLEFDALSRIDLNVTSIKQRTLWRKVFYERFGKNAMLASSSDLSSRSSKKAKEAGHNLIVLNYALFRLFQSTGVRSDLEYRLKALREYELGLSLDYEKDKWGPLRIVLDFLQNHIDATLANYLRNKVAIEFQIIGNSNWLPYSELQNHKNDDIVSIRFRDESPRGYVHENLKQFGSKKPSNQVTQIGQFGEGLKIASAACLRLGLNVDLRSRDWGAEAFSYEVAIGNFFTREEYKNLGFRIYTNKDWCNGSETIIKRPQGKKLRWLKNKSFDEIIETLRNLKQYVLFHKLLELSKEDSIPMLVTSRGDIISCDEGKIFIKNFFITSEESDHLIFSYNFHNLGTNRDRDIVSNIELKQAVGEVLSQIDSRKLIEKVIIEANKNPHGKLYEFQDLTRLKAFKKNANFWASTFRGLFGENAVLASGSAHALKEAEFIGYKVISINKEVANNIRQGGILFDSEVISPTYQFLRNCDLTTHEKNVLELARFLDANEIVFPKNYSTDYKVFEEAKNSVDNRPMPQIRGCANLDGRLIAFKRETLHNSYLFLKVYIEEKAHQLSRATDGTREHFNKAVEGLIWLIMNLKNNTKQANDEIKKLFPDFEVTKLEAPNEIN